MYYLILSLIQVLVIMTTFIVIHVYLMWSAFTNVLLETVRIKIFVSLTQKHMAFPAEQCQQRGMLLKWNSLIVFKIVFLKLGKQDIVLTFSIREDQREVLE